jgi:hypothetical protein
MLHCAHRMMDVGCTAFRNAGQFFDTRLHLLLTQNIVAPLAKRINDDCLSC